MMIIGIGNLYRGDDGVGRFVARQLKDRSQVNVEVLEENGECASLMESWKDAEMVILVDAVQSGATPGTIFQSLSHTTWDCKDHLVWIAKCRKEALY